MKLRRCADRDVWDSLAHSFDQSLFFHTWDWLELQERLLGFPSERYVIEDEGNPVGIFPMTRKASRSPSSPLLPNPFQGPLVQAHLVPEMMRALVRQQLRTGLLLDRFDVGPLLAEAWRPLLAGPRSAVRDRLTVMIDLGGHASPDRLRASYARNHRRSLNRAERAGARVRRAEPGEIAGLLPGILEEAYAAPGRTSPYPADMGRLVEEFASGRDDVGVLTAEVQGEPAGILVILGGRPTALGWVGGCFHRHRDVAANVLLYHEMLVWAMERGHERIDLCGGIDEGALQFKLAFGGRLVAGLHVESSVVPHQVVRTARRVLRRVVEPPDPD